MPELFIIVPIFVFIVVLGVGRTILREFIHRSRNNDVFHWAERQVQMKRISEPVVEEKKELVRDVFRLADTKKGRITVSDVVIQTGLNVREAESFMDKLVDGTHVRIEVDNDGIVFYEFPEIMQRYDGK